MEQELVELETGNWLGRGAGHPGCSGRQRRYSTPLAATPPSHPSPSGVPSTCAPFHSISAAAEHNWSGWGRIYKNALRNWLSVSTAERLVYIKANLACDSDEQESAKVALGIV